MRNRDTVGTRRREMPAGADPANYPSWEGVLEHVGDFVWLKDAAGEVKELLIWLPGNEGGSVAPVPVARGPHAGMCWGWNGDLDKPTLSPSIWRNQPSEARPEPRNEWHGHLVAGVLHSD